MDGIIGFLDLLAKVFPGLEVSRCLPLPHAFDTLMQSSGGCGLPPVMLSLF